MTDQLREEFEAAFNAIELRDGKRWDEYVMRHQIGWTMWQAARASAPAASPGPADERAMFEAWMTSKHPGVELMRRSDGEYWSNVPDNFWEAWQACLAARSVAQGDGG